MLRKEIDGGLDGEVRFRSPETPAHGTESRSACGCEPLVRGSVLYDLWAWLSCEVGTCWTWNGNGVPFAEDRGCVGVVPFATVPEIVDEVRLLTGDGVNGLGNPDSLCALCVSA